MTFIDEPDAIRFLLHRLGVENVMWSSDYPHPVSSWPNSQRTVAQLLGGFSADDRAAMTHGNAERVWNL
jgi:predicted TIM-barrel fold metal-dependent hydrolase